MRERFVERLLQAADERLTLREAAQEDVVGLAVGGDIDVRRARLVASRLAVARSGAAEAGELLLQRLGRLARRVARDLRRHQLVDHFGVRRDALHLRDGNREAPRRRERRDRALRRSR